MRPADTNRAQPRRAASAVAFVLGVVAFGATSSALPVAAQPPRGSQPPVIDLGEEFRIEGRVQKPEAFYFLRRTPFGYVIRSLDQDFLDEVVRSVERAPF